MRFSQVALNPFSDRVRTAKHAPRDGFYLLERSNGLGARRADDQVALEARREDVGRHPEAPRVRRLVGYFKFDVFTCDIFRRVGRSLNLTR